MKLILAMLFLVGCDASISGESTHTVQGEATVRVVVGVDVTACEGLNPEEKAQCIKDLMDLAKIIAAQQSASDALPTTP